MSRDCVLPRGICLVELPLFCGTAEQIVATTTAVVDKDENLRRKIGITLCHRFTGAKLKDIGKCFGISDASVAQTSCRLMKRAADDEKIREVLERIVELLNGDGKGEI